MCQRADLYLQLELIHLAMQLTGTHSSMKISDVKHVIMGSCNFNLQLPYIHAAMACYATDSCRKISGSVIYLQMTATDLFLATDVTSQSVAMSIPGLKIK